VFGRSVSVLEGIVWLVPTVGFVAAGLALLAGLDTWRALALASSVVSLVAVGLYPQQLPAFSLVAAVLVDLAVIVGLAALQWPSTDAVGA